LESQLANLRTAPQEIPSSSLSLSDIEHPKYWQKQVSDYQTFDVKKGSDEWKDICSEFLKGLPGSNIVRIERNQNTTLWMWYFLRRQLVGQNNKGVPNEQLLFHGSRVDAYDVIMKDGLDHRVANLGGAIGAGIYFAPSSGTSAGYVSGQKRGQAKKMLYCRVTLGSVGPGSQGLRRPPEKSKGVLYDSVGSPPTMFVIFDNHQSYPEYMIHYH